MTGPSGRTFATRASPASHSPDSTAGHTRRSFLGRTAALGTAVGLGGLATGTAAAQEAPATVSLTLDAEEIQAGETTDAEIRLSNVPEEGGEYEGISGLTIALSLDDSVAAFTGDHSSEGNWDRTALDMEDEEGDHTAALTASNLTGSIPPGAQDVHVGDVTIEGLAEGDTEVGLVVRSYVDANDQEMPTDASTTSLSVTGGGGGLPEPDDSDGNVSDGDSDGDSDGGTDGDSGGGSDGDSGGDSDGDADGGTDGNVSDGDSDGGADGGTDGGSDGDSGDDGSPGFGVVATVTAVLAGVGARVARSDGSDDAEE